MKVVVSGATGFIGSEVLLQCLSHPDITSVCALTRRPLDASVANHPNLTTIIMEDFLHYPDEVLEQLRGSSAAIWTLGSRFSPDCRTIDIAYSQAAARAFNTYLVPSLPSGTRFRFIHLSGFLTTQDQSASLWFVDEGRKSRGASERKLLDFAAENAATFEAAVTRSGGVLYKSGVGASWWEWLFPSYMISVETLAAAMIVAARDGVAGKTKEGTDREGILENTTLIEMGRKGLTCKKML